MCGKEESAKSRSTCVGNSGEIFLNHLVLPGVELDVDRLGANNSKEVRSKERKKDIIGCSARWRQSLHRHQGRKNLGLEDVGDGDGGIGEDDGEAWPEESVD